MTTPQDTTFTNVRIPAGSGVQTYPATTAVFTTADITINRAGNKGLDSLPAGSTLTVAFDYSLDNGTTWLGCGGETWDGGPIQYVKNGVTYTQTTEELSIGIGSPFPVGTVFRLRTTATNAVTVSGTVEYK